MIRFGEFELDAERHFLRRGGEELHVEPKVFRVIDYLVRNRERLVTKEELLDKVWEETYVSESALTRVIRDARRVLDDSSTSPRWIRTLYGKGFRFIGEIAEGPAPAVSSDSRPTIAVLPFADLSEARDQGFFCEGLADEIINALTKLERLSVLSRKSSFEARQEPQKLGVDKVLDGSVRKAGDRLRVTVHLVDVATRRNLWSERYDRTANDLFAIQEDIAEQTASSLLGVLGEHEHGLLRRTPHAQLSAWEFYLRGRQLAYQEIRRSLEAARQMYARAVEIEPSFALAFSGMADALADLYLYHVRDEQYRAGCAEASRRAIALDPGLAEAHKSRAQSLVLEGKFDEAAEEFETAIALDPRSFDAHVYYGRLLWTHGRGEAAVQHLERAAAIRPDDYAAPMMLVQIYYALGRESDRHNAALRTKTLTAKRLELRPDDVRALCMNAEAQYVLGEKTGAMGQIDRAYAIDPHDVCTLYNSACVFSLDGELERALDAIEGAVRGGYTYREWLTSDPDLVALREHPRFQALMAELPELGEGER
ncbi:MAG TPA: winged helix-turn-helix domain-containing protein [Thermoanaerobaculia bacterium]